MHVLCASCDACKVFVAPGIPSSPGLQDNHVSMLLCRISSKSQEGITCLPLNAYSLVQSAKHEELLVEAGVLLEDGTLLVTQQTFVAGLCTSMSLGAESL